MGFYILVFDFFKESSQWKFKTRATIAESCSCWCVLPFCTNWVPQPCHKSCCIVLMIFNQLSNWTKCMFFCQVVFLWGCCCFLYMIMPEAWWAFSVTKIKMCYNQEPHCKTCPLLGDHRVSTYGFFSPMHRFHFPSSSSQLDSSHEQVFFNWSLGCT